MEDTLAATQQTSEQVVALQGQCDALAAALHLATNRYHASYTGYLDVLDAERGPLNAELVLIQARADRLNAYVALYQAMGGAWSTDDIAGPAITAGPVRHFDMAPRFAASTSLARCRM